MSLKGKHILLGITGSIAAYKAAILIRALVKEGAKVQVVMTPLAKEFISPLTLATLSSRPILVDFFNPENGDWNSHVSLGLWADVFLVAPATVNTLSKMAFGIADNLLLTSYLSCRCPIFVAPAMDLDMYAHSATQQSLRLLKQRGVHIVEPTSGSLASGLEGKGRMEEPDKIVAALTCFFALSSTLTGKKVLVTAGPTFEKIDPVRFVGNFSTGKMGYALAEEFANRGATVTLVSGPVNIRTEHPMIKVVPVESAAEMLLAARECFQETDMVVFAAAVADFTPLEISESKWKRKDQEEVLRLSPTVDIAATLGAQRKPGQILAGFALEVDSGVDHALDKLKRKNLDVILLNSLSDPGAGFGKDTNKVTLLSASGEVITYPLKSKLEIASDIVDYLVALI